MTKICPDCHATVLSPVDGRRPDPAAQFVMWALMEGSWQGANIDGGAAQDKAEALGLIAMTTYDPEKHAESDNAEPGDRWYVPSEMLLSALSSRDAATVLSTSQPELIGTVTDEMVEAAWAAIVGGDIAKTCFNASIIRADLKTGLAAALAATPADDDAVLDSYAEENQRLSDQLRKKCAELDSCSQHLDAAYEAAGLSKSSSKPLAYHILELLAATPAVGGEALKQAEEAFEYIRLKLINQLNEPERSAFWRAVEARDAIRAAPPASPLRGRNRDLIALDAAHQIEALPSDLHEAQKTARIQLIVLHAMASPPEQPAADKESDDGR